MSITAIPTNGLGEKVLEDIQIEALKEWEEASAHSKVVIARIGKHEHPNWVINLDLKHSNERLLQAVRGFYSAFGYLPGTATAPWCDRCVADQSAGAGL